MVKKQSFTLKCEAPIYGHRQANTFRVAAISQFGIGSATAVDLIDTGDLEEYGTSTYMLRRSL